MRRISGQIAETRTVLAGLPTGARLLTVNDGGHGTGLEAITASTIWHMPLTAVIDHDAFVPTLFSGLTTVQIRPEFRRASTPNGLPISLAQLREGAARSDPAAEPGDGQGARLYHFGWPAKFVYVLIQRYGLPIGELPKNLMQIATSRNLTLYAVTPP